MNFAHGRRQSGLARQVLAASILTMFATSLAAQQPPSGPNRPTLCPDIVVWVDGSRPIGDKAPAYSWSEP